MDIVAFAGEAAALIQREAPQATLKDEREFEERHIVRPVWNLAKLHPEIRVFAHPWSRTARCLPNCDAGREDALLRVEGCPRCWETSKEWSMVQAFGTQNNFDLVGMDQDGQTLAMEIKWLTLASRGPNSEFQRFIGQCTLAAARHDVVLGVCAFRGERVKPLDRDDESIRETLRKIGVRLVTLHATSGGRQ